ncbi:GNAT family N-acetyltransferase [Ruegeria lacuscaerulensis]|uniref:GNAT family N-acetyltransferase n=1 Tax=Ruegeria lacuscaerulensis TaxID=55218 RepID=UPI001F2F7466|nr:GNAT family N-acetyltransferase [Ruegeria lacuscaerulensis]
MDAVSTRSEPTLECLEAPAQTLAARADWDDLVAASGADIYFLSDWQASWWDHYGKSFAASRHPICFMLRDGTELVGALPFCIETIWAGPVPVRIARLAGVDPNFAVMALPIAAGHEATVLRAVFDHLTQRLNCAAISFSPMSERATQLDSLRAVDGQGVSLLRDDSPRGHTLMTLPDSFDGFMKALSKSRRREVRRDIKRLTETAPLRNTSSTPDTVDPMMDRFIALHTKQWQAAGKGGHFSDWRVAAAFYRDLLHRLGSKGQAMIDEQWQGGILLSCQLRYTLGDKAYWWLNARETDPEFAKVGLGRVGLVERVEGLIGDGITLVEAGAGEYEYKLSYGGELVPIHNIVLAPDLPLARLRARILLWWADALHLFYYRAWFLKFRPRLGLRPGRLWTSWIRTRL